MDFDELVELLASLVGKAIEASVQVPTFEDDAPPVAVATIDYTCVDRVIGSDDACRLWMTRDDPATTSPNLTPREDTLTFRRDLYIAADFIADRHDDEPVTESGMTWTLKVQQASVQTEIVVYV
jgi:hypothetical protein